MVSFKETFLTVILVDFRKCFCLFYFIPSCKKNGLITLNPQIFNIQIKRKLQSRSLNRPTFLVAFIDRCLKMESSSCTKAEMFTKVSLRPQITSVYTQRPQPDPHAAVEEHGSIIWVWCKRPKTTGWHQWGLPQSTVIRRVPLKKKKKKQSESLQTAVSLWNELRSKCLGDWLLVQQRS